MAPRTTYASLADGLQPFTLWDQSLADMGLLGAIPCTASGTNTVVLTPIAVAYAPTPSYVNLSLFSFVAVNATTGAVTLNVNGLGAKPLYRANGITKAGAGDLTANAAYVVLYNPALNSAAGGFQIIGGGNGLQVFDITAYGASTSNSDNTTFIQNAINAASIAGGMVYVPLGIFQYASALNITTRQVGIIGAGPAANLQYTGSVIGLSFYNNIEFVSLCDLTLSATNSAAGIVQVSNFSQGFYSRNVNYNGGGTQLQITSTTPSTGGAYDIHVIGGNFRGANTVALSVSPGGASASLDQAIFISHVSADTFTKFMDVTGAGNGIFINNCRIERHITSSTSAFTLANSSKLVISQCYIEEGSGVTAPVIASGAGMGGIDLLNNFVVINSDGGTNASAQVLKTSATATNLNVYGNTVNAYGTVGNLLDYGGTPIFARANQFNQGTCPYGFASTGTSANNDIDGTTGGITYSTALQQVGVGRMASDYSNASTVAAIQLGSLGIGVAAGGSGGIKIGNSVSATTGNSQLVAGASATFGGVYGGQGSSYDVTLQNSGGSVAFRVPHGTVNTETPGTSTATSFLASATSNQYVFQSGGVTGTLSWTPSSTNKTITFPNVTGTAITTGDTGSVTNTMLAGSIDLTAKVTGVLPTANGGASAAQAFTPTDQSGASLSLTGVSAQYFQVGNLVVVYGQVTYPTTANGSVAAISLPVAVPNQNYAKVPGTLMSNQGSSGFTIWAVPNTSTAKFTSTASNPNSPLTNASLSTATVWFTLAYPAS